MKILFSFALAFVLSLLCFPQIPLSFQDLTAPSNAFTYDDTSFSKIDEIYNGDGTFDKTNLNKLLQQTSGISTLTSDDLSALSTNITSANITASEMQAFATGGKTAGQDIVVRLGGLDWTPTYLSKTKSGDLILTMWLSNNEQDAFQTRTNNAAEGDFYGYVKGPDTNKYGLYSDWAADWYTSTKSQGTAAFYPSAMYGTSYIRSVTLNNGGQYATSNTELAADPGQKTTSIFAPFTMSSNPLSSFIATPSEVSWQEKQSATATNGASSTYDYPNDEWHPDTAQGKYYSDAYNYVEHNGYDTWKNDKLWLPSMAETGYSISKPGLWNPSVAQRANYNGSNTSFSATIGTSENKNYATTAYTYSWLRSGYYNIVVNAYFLGPSGSVYYSGGVSCARAVRPALHLNLTKAAEVAKDLFENVVSSDQTGDIWKEYDATQNRIIFHIENIEGYKFLTNFVNNEDVDWPSNYVYQIETDLDLTELEYTEYHFEASETRPFSGIFDGQGHTLRIKSKYQLTGSIFRWVSDFRFQNINIVWVEAKGMLVHMVTNSVSVSHVKITCENLLTSEMQSPIIIGGNPRNNNNVRFTVNDVQYYCDTYIAGVWDIIIAGSSRGLCDTYITDCMFITANEIQLINNCCAGNKILFNNVFIQSKEFYLSYNSNFYGDTTLPIYLTCVGCEFYGSSSASKYFFQNLKNTALINIELYDCIFENNSTLFEESNYPDASLAGNKYYYQGVYINGETLDPNFTPSKWFMKGDEPHLRCFYWTGQIA